MLSASRLFHALGDPTRMAVVQQLARAPATVSELARGHAMALPSFLQHLQVLEEAGWIRSTKVGRVRTCQLDTPALDAASSWLDLQRIAWNARLDRLDTYLLTMDDE